MIISDPQENRNANYGSCRNWQPPARIVSGHSCSRDHLFLPEGREDPNLEPLCFLLSVDWGSAHTFSLSKLAASLFMWCVEWKLMCLCVHLHVEARDQCWVYVFMCVCMHMFLHACGDQRSVLHVCLNNSASFLRQVSYWTWHSDSVRLTVQDVPWIFLFLLPSAGIIGTRCHVQLFTWILEIQTQVLYWTISIGL